jgi:hypothetical protein
LNSYRCARFGSPKFMKKRNGRAIANVIRIKGVSDI